MLRRFGKITEINQERRLKMEAKKARLASKIAPPAVMVADAYEMPLAGPLSRTVSAFLVLGWDADRTEVADYNWAYLPKLGYAVKESKSAYHVLYECIDGALHPISTDRAVQRGIINPAGRLIRHGQSAITECRSVRPYLSIYAEADCFLSDGRQVEVLTSITPGVLPCAAWYAGKRPMDVELYVPSE